MKEIEMKKIEIKRKLRKVLAAVLVGSILVGSGAGITLKIQSDEARAKEASLHKEIEDAKAAYEREKGDKNKIKEKLDQLQEKIVEQEHEVDSEVVKSKISKVGELITIQMDHTTTGVLKDSKDIKYINLPIVGTKKSMIIEMDGTIKAGIKVSEIKIDVDEKSKIITVDIPKAYVSSNQLHEKSVVVYDESEGWFTDITVADNAEVRQKIKDRAEENAIQSGFLIQAQENAKSVIAELLNTDSDIKRFYDIKFTI